MFESHQSIFHESLAGDALYLTKYKGIQDLFSFYINEKDSFIANILVSICIYKYNNNIKELTSDNYNQIFENLYGEKVDIIGDAKKDIPRTLKHRD